MKYTVTWLKSVKNQLAIMYMAAADKRALTEASNRIDRELKNDPKSDAVRRLVHLSF